MSEESPREPYRIVIGVDFESTGDQAIADALRLAREHPNAELHPVHVVSSGGPKSKARKVAELARDMEESVEAMKKRVQEVCAQTFPSEQWEQETVFHVRLGEPAEALHQVAVDYDANLLVVGTNARKGLEKLVLGSVAEKLTKIAHLPVLVARPRTLDSLERSPKPEAAREGESLNDEVHRSERVRFGRRASHIAGLI